MANDRKSITVPCFELGLARISDSKQLGLVDLCLNIHTTGSTVWHREKLYVWLQKFQETNLCLEMAVWWVWQNHEIQIFLSKKRMPHCSKECHSGSGSFRLVVGSSQTMFWVTNELQKSKEQMSSNRLLPIVLLVKLKGFGWGANIGQICSNGILAPLTGQSQGWYFWWSGNVAYFLSFEGEGYFLLNISAKPWYLIRTDKYSRFRIISLRSSKQDNWARFV